MLSDHPLLLLVLLYIVLPAAGAMLAYLTASGNATHTMLASHSKTNDDMGISAAFAPGADWADENYMRAHLFDSSGISDMAHSHVNPATGLPMRGTLDLDGNPYGTSSSDSSLFDINPANGLPMVDDMSDIAGNSYGTDSGIFDSFNNHGGLGSSDSFDSLDSFDSFHSNFDD
jgi:hypothetical protein